MRESLSQPALMSKAQLDWFRSQLEVKREAAFLAPQLLEQVVILTRDLQDALAEVETLRAGMAEIERALGDLLGTMADRPLPREIAAVLDRVRQLRSA